MRGENIKILRTRELDGCPLYHMQIVTGLNKISIVCAYENKLTMWYLTLINDEFGDPSVDVDAVKSILSRVRQCFTFFIIYLYLLNGGNYDIKRREEYQP